MSPTPKKPTAYDSAPDAHDAIRNALASLPREPAASGFTERVVARAAAHSTSPRVHPVRLRLAAVLAIVLVGGAFFARHRLLETRVHRQRAALLQQHQQLRRELQQLQRRAASAPTLYLSSAPDYDIVLDLEPWLGSPTAQPTAQPAAYSRNRQ